MPDSAPSVSGVATCKMVRSSRDDERRGHLGMADGDGRCHYGGNGTQNTGEPPRRHRIASSPSLVVGARPR